MRQEEMRQFTYRISNANRSELVVITYDIVLSNLKEAIMAVEIDDTERLKNSVAKAGAAFERLKQTLDFKYEIANNLYAIYQYCEMLSFRAVPCRDEEGLRTAVELMERLRESFRQVSEQDDSPAMMKNSQQVMAGMTYGRGSLTETYDSLQVNRGYWA